jgi:putative nucleotidyltransferase with HDIG domain
MLRKALADLERSYDITLEALGDALDLKDAETEGHSKRVTAFTIAIARAMELPQDRVRVMARGAFLHDVGKMAIPDAILRKPGRLSDAEQAIMREHAYLGYQILRKIPFLGEAADIVYSHQECYDGSGYPRGLKGEQIPLGARIFAVADTFDAMTSDRPYRAAQSISSGRREIERNAGKQFDPAVVKVFLNISEHIWQELRNEIEAQGAKRRYGARISRRTN